jgi:hypothetical protein
MRTKMKWWAAAVVATLSISLPAAVDAAPIDTASDHVALSAYGRYLQGVLSGLPVARSADNAYVASIATACPNVLAAVNLLPPRAVNRATAIAFGEELGGDILVVGYHADRAPLATLAATLRRLRWSSPQTSATIKSFLTAQRNLFHLGPSHLCSDASALAASNFGRTPPGTLRWLARLGRLSSAEHARFATFFAVLEKFQAPDDRTQIDANNRLVGRFMAAFPVLVRSEAARLGSALGLSF